MAFFSYLSSGQKGHVTFRSSYVHPPLTRSKEKINGHELIHIAMSYHVTGGCKHGGVRGRQVSRCRERRSINAKKRYSQCFDLENPLEERSLFICILLDLF